MIRNGMVLLGVVLFASFLQAQQDEFTAEQLLEATRSGDLERITQIVESGVDINSKTEYGSTALFFACDRGHVEVVKYLLKKGAEVDVKDTFYNATPITWAQANGHDEITLLLLKAGAEGADEILATVVRQGKVDMAQSILKAGVVTEGGIRDAKELAENSENEDLISLFENLDVSAAPEFTLTKEQVQKYVGNYLSGSGQIVEVTATDEKLKFKAPGGTSMLKPIDVDKFKVGTSSVRFVVVDGNVTQLVVEAPRQTMTYQRVSKEEADKAIAEAKKKAEEATDNAAKKVFAESSPESKAADLAISSPNWPGFRGNGARGVADGQSAPLEWNVEDSNNVVWKTQIPGLGNSCPSIWGDKLFVTSAVNPEADNEFRIGLYGDVGSVEEDFEFEFVLYCLDKNSGEVLWKKTANRAKPAVKRHAKSSHANPTVATDGKYVVAFFGSEGLYCYDLDGNLQWMKNLGVLDSGWFYDPGYQWGFGASPTLFEDKVIIQCDIQKDSYVAAFRLSDGEEVWKTPRENEIPSWSTPIVHEFGETPMLITHATRAARGYDARTGEELWSMRDHSEIVVPVPFVAHNLIYVASGYSPIQPIVAIRPDARGDITLPDNTLSSDSIAWSTKRGGPYMPSPIVYGDYLYCCANSGILTCYEAKTGEVVYKKRMRADGGSLSFTGSPIAADGHLYLTAEDGRTLVVKAGPEYELVATNQIGENVLTTPAISDGRMFIRGQKHVFALGSKK